MKKSKLILVIICILIIISIFIFALNNNKKVESGNNDNNQILNMNSYKAQIELTVISNKNTNKYIILQMYMKTISILQRIIYF